jgi:hypothetical protein
VGNGRAKRLPIGLGRVPAQVLVQSGNGLIQAHLPHVIGVGAALLNLLRHFAVPIVGDPAAA